MNRGDRLLSIGLFAVLLSAVVFLNLRPRYAHCPSSLAGIDDAPYANPRVAENYFNDEYRAVEYGFPFDSFERMWPRDDPTRVESEILIGAFGNVFVYGAVLAVMLRVLRNCGKPANPPESSVTNP